MRRLVFLAMLSGCAFRPGGDGGADDVAVTDGGDEVVPDGAVLSIDAPPPACADGDGDGVCDAEDAWPCGATAPTQASAVMTGDNNLAATISNVSITGGGADGGRVVVATAGAALSYQLTWSLRDNDVLCSTCQDQIEVGLVAGKRHGCVFDANPPQNQTQTGTATMAMTAPTTPGVYALRFRLARDFGCNAFGRDDWWIAAPTADQTFGVICVPR